MFLPYRTTLAPGARKVRFPLVTVLFALLGLFVFGAQRALHAAIDDFARDWCAQQEQRLVAMLVAPSNETSDCAGLFAGIHRSWRPVSHIIALSRNTNGVGGLDREQGARYLRDRLEQSYARFRPGAPANLSSALAFYPDRAHVPTFISASFAHANWAHLAGNLIFFLVFAAAVERMLGHFSLWVLVIALSVASQLAWLITARAIGATAPSIGLSGVIMGLITLLAVMQPRTRIYFMTFLLAIWRPGLPVWVLAAGYVGWDIFQQVTAATSGVNYAAHLGGAALGAVVGVVWRLADRRVVTAFPPRRRNRGDTQGSAHRPGSPGRR